jgi:hypothetical protein
MKCSICCQVYLDSKILDLSVAVSTPVIFWDLRIRKLLREAGGALLVLRRRILVFGRLIESSDV